MEIPRHWRIKEQRLRMVGEICPHCDAKNFPPRDVCPHCESAFSKQNVNLEPNASEHSIDITNPSYYRKSEDQYSRDIISYSDILKPEISIEVPTHIISGNLKQVRPSEVVIYQSVQAEV
jgi:uncharacterized OB-fold protein